MKKKSLKILLASVLAAGAVMLAGCGGNDKPGPTPGPTPEPPPTPPIVVPTYSEEKLPEVGITTDPQDGEFDITKPLNVSFNGVEHAKEYEVKYGSVNSTDEALIKVENVTENNNKYSFTIEVDAEGDYRIYVKAKAASESEQKKENEGKDKVTIYTDSDYAIADVKGVDYVKQEFLEFDKTIKEIQLASSKNGNSTNDVVIDDIVAFNNNQANTLDVWSMATVRGKEKIEKYAYTIPGVEQCNSFKELTNKLISLEGKTGSRKFSHVTSTFGNPDNIDCWDKLTTTDKLSETTGLKKALNSEGFEKIVCLSEGPSGTTTSYQDFNMFGLVKYNDGTKKQIAYFKENINQFKSDNIINYIGNCLRNFINDTARELEITETEFEVLPELNITYLDYLNKYQTTSQQQKTSKATNKRLSQELALAAYEKYKNEMEMEQ